MRLKKLNITSQKAMTLIELMLVIAVLGVIVTIAIPSYQSYIDKTDNALAVSQILTIQSVIERYYLQNHRYPAKLDGPPEKIAISIQLIRNMIFTAWVKMVKPKNRYPKKIAWTTLYWRAMDGL